MPADAPKGNAKLALSHRQVAMGGAQQLVAAVAGTLGDCWFTCNNKSYDVAYARDATGTRGRFHHVTYAVDQREHILQAADVFLENGVHIETGPHKHAIQQTFFLYV
jgi:catechol 2,3-dioxygenase